MKVLVIDNYDSFVYNLVQYVGERGMDVVVRRNDVGIEELQNLEADRVIISPGPGRPEGAGVSEEAVRKFSLKIPILGVCLGHQVIVQYFGGKIGHAPEPVHGKPSRVTHNAKGIFAGVENPLQAGRYHSLIALNLPECLEKIAEFEGLIMGVQHKELPIFGVQFHPESILTPAGGKIIENILSIAVAEKQRQKGR